MIQLTKDLAMTADEHCYIVGKPCQRAEKAPLLRNPTYQYHRRTGCLCRA